MNALAATDVSALSVAVVMGGTSSERDVSLASGSGVAIALREGRSARERARRVIEVEVGADARWRVGGEALEPCAALARLADVDVFFLALHGGGGEDGTLQGLLECAGRRYTGSGVGASAVCMDKVALRGLAREAGLAVARGACVDSREWRGARGDAAGALRDLAGRPLVVKPRNGGSSVDTAVVDGERDLAAAVERVLASGDSALIEERVDGVELSCGVLGNWGDELVALTPIEIRPGEGRFFDYQQKYAADGAREICPPESVGAATVARVREIAARIHALAGCDGYSRADFIAPREAGREAEPVLLEVNTLPGLTSRSLLPQMARADGIEYGELVRRIVALALRRGKRSVS
jgi:D-alanine-D-alanine ligase